MNRLVFKLVCCCAVISTLAIIAFVTKSIEVVNITPGNRPPTNEEVLHTIYFCVAMVGFSFAVMLFFPFYVWRFAKCERRSRVYEAFMVLSTSYSVFAFLVFLV